MQRVASRAEKPCNTKENDEYTVELINVKK